MNKPETGSKCGDENSYKRDFYRVMTAGRRILDDYWLLYNK